VIPEYEAYLLNKNTSIDEVKEFNSFDPIIKGELSNKNPSSRRVLSSCTNSIVGVFCRLENILLL
jgi:hypothetical protein